MKATLAQFRLLLAVIEAGSIGAAARRLGLTQSGVSQAMIALERGLGAELLTRTRDGVAPTAFALSILNDVRSAASAAQRIEGHARAARSQARRHLRIACVPSVATNLLPEWSKHFRGLHPGIEVSVFEGNHIEVGEWVAQGVADIGLAAAVPAGLAAEHLRDEEMFVVAPSGHPLLRSAAVEAQALSSTMLVMAGRGCDPVLSPLFAAIGRPLPPAVRAQDVMTAIEMIRQGMGVTILPESALPRAGLGDLCMRPFVPHAYRQLRLLTRVDAPGGGVIAGFRDIARRRHEGRLPH